MKDRGRGEHSEYMLKSPDSIVFAKRYPLGLANITLAQKRGKMGNWSPLKNKEAHSNFSILNFHI